MNFKKIVNTHKYELIEKTSELIQIKSTLDEPREGMPFGKGMSDALEFVLNLAREMGFTAKNLDGYCGYIEYGEGDLYVGVISHVDTYPEGNMWVIPPYEGRIVKNRIYGRGSMDNKGPLMAALFALNAVRESGKKLNKKIRLIVGTDEERYYRDMEYYLSREKPPIAGFTLDGQFPVVFAEKGLAVAEFHKRLPREEGSESIQYIRGGTAENTVPGYCEAFLVTNRQGEVIKSLVEFARTHRHNMQAKAKDNGVLIKSYGVETHSMALELGQNAIAPMLRFLLSLDIGAPPIRETLRLLDHHFGFHLYGEMLGIAFEDEFSGKLTTNLGIFQYDGEYAKVRIDVRYPVTCDFAASFERVKELFESNGFWADESAYWDPVYFPQEHFLIKALLKAYREVTKDVSEPISSGSGSYSKVIPNVAAFGAIFPGESQAWHQINEYIDIDNLVKMCEIYASAIYELGTL